MLQLSLFLLRKSTNAHLPGVLDGAGFCARVTAHSVDVEEGEYTKQGGNVVPGMPQRKDKAVFLVKFSQQVLERDASLDR